MLLNSRRKLFTRSAPASFLWQQNAESRRGEIGAVPGRRFAAEETERRGRVARAPDMGGAPHERLTCDVLVVGTGAAGSMAALVAASHGLDVLLVEKEALFGGTTAISGGWVWAPCNAMAQSAGLQDSPQAALQYLRYETNQHGHGDLIAAFVSHARDAIEFLQTKTEVTFDQPGPSPDYHGQAPGAVSAGRSLMPQAMDGRSLGADLRLLRPPLSEFTFMGMMLGSGRDVLHFMRATRSLRSFSYVARRMASHIADIVRYGRGMSLANGNALAGRLLLSLRKRGVSMQFASRVSRLLHDADGVHGALVETASGTREVHARRAVVLACGGGSHDLHLQATYAHVKGGGDHFSLACAGSSGDGFQLANEAGACLDFELPQNAAWVPVSRVPRRDGTFGIFPHFIDRGKPGVIAVDHRGERFTNEAANYHDFVKAMVAAAGSRRPVRAHLICDHPTLRRYGLGAVRPAPLPFAQHLRSGYLYRASTMEELARRMDVDPQTLQKTMDRCRLDAASGKDSAFGKGDTEHNRHMGDALIAPNPCFGPVSTPPFYAVELAVGDLGTFAGIRTDGAGRALNKEGRVIKGLYAIGNDMASVFAGSYPSAGATLGAALTFGYIAGTDLAREPISPENADEGTGASPRQCQ